VPDEPVILLGDFNCFPRSDPYYRLSEQLVDAGYAAVPPLSTDAITFHDYTGKTVRSRLLPHVQQIDYIWLKDGNAGSFKVHDFRILHDHPESARGVYPSDHWPVMADLEFV